MDTVIDNVTGYLAVPGCPPSLTDAFARALAADGTARGRMRQAGVRLAADRDYARVVRHLVGHLLSG